MKTKEKNGSIAFSRYVRISPQKIRRVLNQLKGKKAKDALYFLKFLPCKSSSIIIKVLLSAVSNLKNTLNVEKNQVIIKEVRVDEGPVLKRFCPHAQGRGFPIRKRTSHISIIVSNF
uniref:Large ribosomal subunit protein uL22c n=1 Tax=Euglena mutabilis TaxID=38275 RepID=A0A1B0UL16_EUGMU|nr:ribosomal protein L22 [Euglena mutabilis]